MITSSNEFYIEPIPTDYILTGERPIVYTSGYMQTVPDAFYLEYSVPDPDDYVLTGRRPLKFFTSSFYSGDGW